MPAFQAMISVAAPSRRLQPAPLAVHPPGGLFRNGAVCASFANRRAGVERGLVLRSPEKKKKKKMGVGGVDRRTWAVCGFGYWVQGFRCFPWLALNFHLAHGLGLGPSALQLVQGAAILPMVAKPLYGLFSDSSSAGAARRLPYSLGLLLQMVSWGSLALAPTEELAAKMGFILVGSVGAALTEVVGDAIVAELSRESETGSLHSCSFMALAAGAMLGNLSGGIALAKTRRPDLVFLAFTALLAAQLALALTANLGRGGRAGCEPAAVAGALRDERLRAAVAWIACAVGTVPLLPGPVFCFQTKSLKLDPTVIGLSKVVGQVMVLSLTLAYRCGLKAVPLRKLVFWVQVAYAASLLSDLALVKQLNLRVGISNEAYVLCASAMAEAVAQFRVLPFSVLLARLCPPGCEGELFALFGSALCSATIVGGALGLGLAAAVGAAGGEPAGLGAAISLQFVAALLPLFSVCRLPTLPPRKRY
ncbi:major facilitator superfamily protein isoform X1 [Wolffia australiana]